MQLFCLKIAFIYSPYNIFVPHKTLLVICASFMQQANKALTLSTFNTLGKMKAILYLSSLRYQPMNDQTLVDK